MKKIDINNWKEYRIGKLFDIHPTKSYKLTNKDLFQDNGIHPVIVNSCYNNGVGGYTNLPTTEQGNKITFSDTTTADSIFYQETDFVGYPHIQGLYPIMYIEKWNKYTLLFFATIFKQTSLTQNYDYGNKFTRDSAKSLIIRLPADATGEPNWQYMENYMKNIESNVREKIHQHKSTKENINIKKWKEFHLYDENLFKIDAGSKLDRVKMASDNPEINFVGRANANNGITCQVNKIPNIEPYEAGNLTLALGGAYLGSCFVQEKAFYTSQNVVVLIPKTKIPLHAKYFIATMIFKEGQTHYKAFIDELNRHIKKDFTIKLPIDSLGNPDFTYMETYMKSIIEQQYSKLELLRSL